MYTFYVTTDPTSGQVQGIPSPENFDGAIAVQINDESTKEYFTRWPQGYAIKNGQLIAPGWAPNLSTDAILATVNQQNADIGNLKAALNDATKQQLATMQQTHQDSADIKAQLNEMTKQMVTFMTANSQPSAPAATTDTKEE